MRRGLAMGLSGRKGEICQQWRFDPRVFCPSRTRNLRLSSSSAKIADLSIPRTMMWWRAPGTSSRAWRGMEAVTANVDWLSRVMQCEKQRPFCFFVSSRLIPALRDSSPHTFGLGFLQTPPRDDALALLLPFGPLSG